MTLDEKIGQLIMFGFDALELNDHAIRLIKEYKAGNVLLFARNIKTPKQLFQLNQNLQKLAMETLHIPLLISIDQEGGMVTRIKNGATYFPGAMTISATHHIQNAYESGKRMGKELKALGINMNFAPVLDVNNNPYNPIIGTRSFGDQPDLVSQYGTEVIRGLQESVIATAKHFPGHGDTKVDSHVDLPTIEKSLSDLEAFELIPFQAAIDGGVKAIMSAHITFPRLTEEGLPTTLSYKCLTEVLRKQLGFKGLIVTDCLQMKAIQTYYTTKIGSLMAISAGANLIMISHSENLQVEAIEYIKEKVLSGELDISIINDRVAKVLEYKFEMDELDFSQTYENIQAIVENKDTKRFALDVTRQALTLIKGKLFCSDKKTLLIASSPLATTIADEDDGSYSIICSVQQALPEIDTFEVSVTITDSEIKELITRSKQYEQIVFCSYNANIYQNQLTLIRELKDIVDLHVIAMRNPYDSFFEPNINNLVLLYEYTPNSVKVLIEYLRGTVTPLGIAPIEL